MLARHHHLTMRFLDKGFSRFDDGPVLRNELEAFVHGAEFGSPELENLTPWVMALAMLRIEERSLEAAGEHCSASS